MRDTPQTDETHIFQIKYTTATVYLLLCTSHSAHTYISHKNEGNAMYKC